MVRILTDEEQQWLEQAIASAQRIVICGHVNPDGDAIGSTLALKWWLTGKGKQVTVAVPNYFPDFLHWMPGAKNILLYSKSPEEVKKAMQEADLMLLVDFNQTSRMNEMEEAVNASKAVRVLIDHHLDPDRSCASQVVSRPEMCAASEVVCHLLWQLGEWEHVTLDAAICLYAGMMCDTGAFTYNSSRSVIYECISHLLEKGVDKDRIYRNVFWTCSPQRIRLQGYMLYVKMQLMLPYHASIMTLTNKERKRFKCVNGDTEGIVNMPLQISRMRLSIFLSEDTEHPERIRVSLRSVDDFPCNEMSAQFFNGGGHRNASGGHLECSMEEAVEIAQKAIQAFATKLK